MPKWAREAVAKAVFVAGHDLAGLTTQATEPRTTLDHIVAEVLERNPGLKFYKATVHKGGNPA